jgi:starch phosphorylase
MEGMDDLDFQAETLAQKIRHYLITTSGHTADDPRTTPEEFYQAFCNALREEIMINWMATLETIRTKKVRIAHYFSMEYLPGRLMGNNMTNIGAMELVRATTKKLGRDFRELISIEPDPGLGNGGLGRLGSCLLDSVATLKYPVRAFGLRYQYGIFEQEIWGGMQFEQPDRWLLYSNPWEVRRDPFSFIVRFHGKISTATNKHGEPVYLLDDPEEVRGAPYDIPIVGYAEKGNFAVIPLRLWSTKESPRNFLLERYNEGLLGEASENTSLTDVLYPNDKPDIGKRLRLKQEFLLASASLHDIIRRHLVIYEDLSQFADKTRIQINDTHPALAIAELVRMLTKHFEFTWKDAWETTQAIFSYTNHTVLREALEEWSEQQLGSLLPRQYRVIQRLNQEFCDQIRARYPQDEARVHRLSVIENGRIRMAHLAILGSHKVNGVAKLHTEIIKNNLFKDFAEMFPDKFINVTNGVTQRRWLLHSNPRLADFITKRIGDGWITDFLQIDKLRAFAKDKTSQEEFLAIKKANKDLLIDYLKTVNPIRNRRGKIVSHYCHLTSNALFDIQVKRIHEYKRQLMNALHLIMIYYELKANPESRKIERLSLFGGKSAPGYDTAKKIIQLLCAIGRKVEKDLVVSKKLEVVFLENYNVSKAEMIIPAADLSEQISTAGFEASGTGNMKFSMNGALTIGTEDGANIEMRESVTDPWWPFRFGSTAEENRQPYHSNEIYQNDPQIRQAVDALISGEFSETEEEKNNFASLHHDLIHTDYFKVLKDLRSYHTTQKKVEELYINPLQWAEYAIQNIAGMGPFSTDQSIHNYSKLIWKIAPCPIDPAILAKVREEYSQHDRCRIVPRKNGT